MKSTLQTIAVALAVFCAAGSSAAQSRLYYSGVVTSKDSTTAGLLNNIQVGDRVDGYLSYDPSGVLDENSGSVFGIYSFTAVNSSFAINVYDKLTGAVLHYSSSGALSQITTSNNWSYPGYPTIDAFSPEAALPNGIAVYLYLQNRNTNLDYITSDVLPEPGSISYSNYNHTKGTMASSTSIGQVYFNLTNVTFIP